ncbi:MAG: tRNA (guanosine(37)-N1)-methyltransferase TrmD [Chloroflexi bacterium RBG_16_68_14]|nr:MAG: tRNA (guanosine(37)-N1)-methyltransferase TrmD [Chloroflexi bacterium RBG_16_68_14]
MHIDIITLFPEMFRGPFDASIVARAVEQGLVQIELHNLRDWGEGRHKVVDDSPHGGGAGMVLKPEPLFAAVEAVRPLAAEPGRVVLLTPQGRLLTQAIVNELAQFPRLVLLCGHYEGVDERVREHLVDDEISIGDYVLSGGEPAAMVLVDAVVRRLPGALGSEASLAEESHAQGLLEYPQYTRPADYRGWRVPDILLSGHHEEVRRWRRRQSLLRTARRRPDLLAKACLTDEERRWLEEELASD